MRQTLVFSILTVAVLALAVGCEDPGQVADAEDDFEEGVGGDADGDADSDGDGDTDADTEGNGTVTLGGEVMAPSGLVPIPGALVYLSLDDGPELEDEVFCYECDDMTGKHWTLSGPDGTWSIEGVLPNDWNIVTRKGFFQRQRAIAVTEEPFQEVPTELTTLPGEGSADGLDQIPSYAVLSNTADPVHNLLAKFGMGEVSAQGTLVYGSESFTLFTGSYASSALTPIEDLFVDQETLNWFHQVFFSCPSNLNPATFVHEQAEMLREYVYAGGKIYNSCCSALWTDYAFPDYIDFYGGDGPDDPTDVIDVGRISTSAYSTVGEVVDLDLRAWLDEVTDENLDSFPFDNGYVKIDELVDVDDGMGLEEDDFWVKPYAWVTDLAAYPGSPLMVTYNYHCGEVFYSVYETTSHFEPSPDLKPQEYVLLYLILEVGVCEGEYEPPE
jgi:hypothetical protein